MKYKKRAGKYVFEKDGVYFSLTPSQVYEMFRLLSDIIENKTPLASDQQEG